MMQSIATLNRIAVLPPPRAGLRPLMQRVLPHVQLNQLPTAETLRELIQSSLAIPNVRYQQSRMASQHTCALVVEDRYAAGPPEAFIDQHEFCHISPLSEGSIHLTLPALLGNEVVELGWGERHPIAKAGILTTLLTVYAPRNRHELASVLGIIEQSCKFAKGELPALSRGANQLLEVI